LGTVLDQRSFGSAGDVQVDALGADFRLDRGNFTLARAGLHHDDHAHSSPLECVGVKRNGRAGFGGRPIPL
jgi:hypothetical protein